RPAHEESTTRQKILPRPNRREKAVACVTAAFFSPSARTGPVAAIMVSVHPMKAKDLREQNDDGLYGRQPAKISSQ
ncbi:MAG TPA: hypothetical protein VLC51_02635, partial [Nitrospira sp.]|nr:hypothetical protein [Nitrospira sp.]